MWSGRGMVVEGGRLNENERWGEKGLEMRKRTPAE